LWAVTTAPVDATPRLTLAADGSLDSGTNAGTHLGLTEGATTFSGKPKMTHIAADQADGPVDAYVPQLDASIEVTLQQLNAIKLQRVVGVGAYSTAAGYRQMTFGGATAVPSICLAVISARRDLAAAYVYSMLFKAIQTAPLTLAFGRAKPAAYKVKFQGLSDLTRTLGKQIGVTVNQLVATTGGTATAKDYTTSEIQQGPADLWIVGTPPNDTAQRLTLAADFTPDATAHPNSVCLGMTESAITMTITPKIELIKADQADGAGVDAYCTALECKLEATLTQASLAKLTQALGLGTAAYAIDAGGTPAWEQIGFGGLLTPAEFAVAAIAPKRSDATKLWVGMLYKVVSGDGVSLVVSRAKEGTYKVTFTALNDLTRTAGRQQGIVYETI
jgi:hypothetical protein